MFFPICLFCGVDIALTKGFLCIYVCYIYMFFPMCLLDLDSDIKQTLQGIHSASTQLVNASKWTQTLTQTQTQIQTPLRLRSKKTNGPLDSHNQILTFHPALIVIGNLGLVGFCLIVRACLRNIREFLKSLCLLILVPLGFERVIDMGSPSNSSPSLFPSHHCKTLHLVDNLHKHVHACGLAKKVDLVIASPLLRTMQTAVGVFGGDGYKHGVNAIPLMVENAGKSSRSSISSLNSPLFVAVELCRELLGVHPCDKRRSITEYQPLFPVIDFSLVTCNIWVYIFVGSEEILNPDELQCRGSLDKVLKRYRWIAMYPTLKKLVDDMGYADFCSINTGNLDNRLIHALVERWWPSTHICYFPCGELGFTPLDFVMLTGISFGRGRELPYDERYSKLEEAENMFPGITSSDMRSTKLRRPEVRVASALSTQRVPLVSVPYGHNTLWYLGDRCMRQMIGLDSVPYDPPQEIMKFSRYDRELYQSLKDVDFYDDRDYLIPDVDYMTYWHLVHQNPKIVCTIVKMTGNILSVGRDLVRPDVIFPPTSSLATSSQVQDYGVQATDDPCDIGWFMDVAGPNDQRRRIPIPVMQVPFPCPPTYSTDESWHQN
ncbi:hypothetical protein GIB67_037061 [Kingdonia uniflora]|uniref:Aminotransferase-like plant mobile domain-containing protein n=1 Tax=Kingdonia uniflora TaxID=39325 RepID=A0A7J7LHN1_9MAGN|nr:hypothetical protein GIB67_037061 [Kingdonia uniflora]